MSVLRRARSRVRALSDDAPSRFIDVAMNWEVVDGDVRETVLAVGGVWDSLEQCWTARTPKTAVVHDLHPGQAKAARDFAGWLRRHLQYLRLRGIGASAEDARLEAFTGVEPVYRWHWYGGRRAGKSHLAVLALVAYSLAVRGARLVVLSPTHPKDREIRDSFCALTPVAWRKPKGKTYQLVTGSTIEFHTGGVKRDQKLGGLHFALINDAQACSESAFMDVSGGLPDHGGAIILAYNPPKRQGKWLVPQFNRLASGEDRNARGHFFDPRRNPHVDLHALLAMDYDPLEFRRNVLGDMTTPTSPVVFPGFSVHTHIRLCVQPDWIDITEDVSRSRLGLRGQWIAGLDFDKGAGCAWTLSKVYRRPQGDKVLLVHAGRREVEYVESQLDARLLEGARALMPHIQDPREVRRMIPCVGDASGEWQHTGETGDRHKGLSSFGRLRRHGWRVVSPDPHSVMNPRPSIKRYELGRALLARHRLQFLDEADEVYKAVQSAPTKKDDTIERDRRSPLIHIVDALTYKTYRLFCDDLELTDPTRSRSSVESRAVHPDIQGFR